MHHSLIRPQSSQMIPVKKYRNNKVPSDIEKVLEYNPWISMYKQNFNKKTSKEKENKSVLEKSILETPKKLESDSFQKSEKMKPRPRTSYNQNGPSEILTNKSLAQNAFKVENKSTKNEKITKLTNNFFKNGEKLQIEINPESLNGPKISVVKANSNVHNDLNTFEKKCQTRRVDKKPERGSQLARNPNSLINEFPELKNINQSTPFQNILGQTEEWMDVRDKLNPAVYTKLVTHNTGEFLASNIRGLVNSQNEYYPFLTGKCLCSQCTCSNCRCVHFKYKLGQNVFSLLKPDLDELMSEYKKEFGPKKITANPKRKSQTGEIQLIPFKVNYNTTNSLYFGLPSNIGVNCHKFPIKAKMDNLGPNVCPVFCGINSNTSYKNDYPDWKCLVDGGSLVGNQNFVRKTMPFMGKAVNREYGAFHKQGDNPATRTPCVPENRNNVLPVFENCDSRTNETDYQRNFIPKNLGDDKLQNFRPVHNLQLEVV